MHAILIEHNTFDSHAPNKNLDGTSWKGVEYYLHLLKIPSCISDSFLSHSVMVVVSEFLFSLS